MTPVPVVSATLTTRTYKEFGGDFPHDTETPAVLVEHPIPTNEEFGGHPRSALGRLCGCFATKDTP